MGYKQGFFKPNHPEKYKGDPTNIVYRSSWELKLMMHLDSHPNVIKWGSEEFAITYISPLDGRPHRYFPDFIVQMINKEGVQETVVIEIKPLSQTKEPIPSKRKTKKYIKEVYTWGVNKAKWDAAINYCNKKGWKFQIFTEQQLGIR